MQLELEKVVPNAVAKDVDGARTTHKERSPPPMVVLGTEHKVDMNECYFDRRNQEDERDEPKESIDVVVARLFRPHGSEDKQKFNKDDCKGNDAGDEQRGKESEVARLFGDLAWYLVGFRRMLHGRTSEANETSQQD